MITRVLDNRDDCLAEIKEIDISTDSQLEDKFGFLLPVVSVNGKIVSELKVDGKAVREALT